LIPDAIRGVSSLHLFRKAFVQFEQVLVFSAERVKRTGFSPALRYWCNREQREQRAIGKWMNDRRRKHDVPDSRSAQSFAVCRTKSTAFLAEGFSLLGATVCATLATVVPRRPEDLSIIKPRNGLDLTG
jgi:hypothetical protein